MNTQAQRTVTIFGSSRPRPGEVEYGVAYELGASLARAGMTVCTGGFAGIMEAASRGAKEAGGTTIGVTFTTLGPRQPNAWVDTVVEEVTLVDRAMKLISLADACIVMKGGTGTLLELALAWEHVNKGLIPEKPILILGSFWKEVVDTLNEELSWEGLGRCTRYVRLADSVEHAVAMLAGLPPRSG